MRNKVKPIALLLAIIMLFSLVSCAGGGDAPAPTETSAAETALPTEASTPEPTQIPPSDEGMEIDADSYALEPLPGELKLSSLQMPLQPDAEVDRENYSFYFKPLPEYDPDREDEYRVDGKRLNLMLYNSHLAREYGTRAVTDPSDLIYIRQHTADLEYEEFPDDGSFPPIWLFITFTAEDGSAEHYALGRDNFIYRAEPQNESDPNEVKYTHISKEPVADIVHLHFVAAVFHYLHQYEPLNSYFAYADYSGLFANAYLVFGDRSVSLSDPMALSALEDLLTATRTETNEKTGESVEYQCFLKDFEGTEVTGALSDLPENCIRIVLYNDDGSEPENIRWGFMIAPDGSAYNVMAPFGITDYAYYYYLINSAIITPTPDTFDYNALLAFFEANAE